MAGPFRSVYDLIPTESAFDHIQQALRATGDADHRFLRLSWAEFQQGRPVIEDRASEAGKGLRAPPSRDQG